jgi:hypothetical protein
MKFFLPVQETKIAEESYQAIKKFIEKQTGWPVSVGVLCKANQFWAAMRKRSSLSQKASSNEN